MKKSTGCDLAYNFYGITDDNSFEKPKNYGAEISTLIELFEKEKVLVPIKHEIRIPKK